MKRQLGQVASTLDRSWPTRQTADTPDSTTHRRSTSSGRTAWHPAPRRRREHRCPGHRPAGGTQRPRCLGQRDPRGDDVVDDDGDGARRAHIGRHRPVKIRPPRTLAETGRVTNRPGQPHRRHDGQPEQTTSASRQAQHVVTTASPHFGAGRRHRNQDCARYRDRHERASQHGCERAYEIAPAAFFVGQHRPAQPADIRAGGGNRERRAAEKDRCLAGCTGAAQRAPGRTARGAMTWQNEIDQRVQHELSLPGRRSRRAAQAPTCG